LADKTLNLCKLSIVDAVWTSIAEVTSSAGIFLRQDGVHIPWPYLICAAETRTISSANFNAININ